jgi:tetratricopeptide (TPR) repeat protein
MARSLWVSQKHEESLKFYDEALIVSDKNPEILFEKAVVLRDMGRHWDAYRIFQQFTFDSRIAVMLPSFLDKIIDRGKDTVQAAKFHYRELDAILNHPKKALSYWQKKLKDTNVDMTIKSDIATHTVWPQFEDLRRSQKASALQPLNNVGYLLHKLGRDEEALFYLEVILDDFPDNVYALNTAKSILSDANLRYNIVKKDKSDRAMRDQLDKEFLIKEINRITRGRLQRSD